MSDDLESHVGGLQHSSVALAHDLARLPLAPLPAVVPLATIFTLGWLVYGRDGSSATGTGNAVVLIGLFALLAAFMMTLTLAGIIADDRQRFDVHQHGLVCYTRPPKTLRRLLPLIPPLADREREVTRWAEVLTVRVVPGRLRPSCRLLLRTGRELSFEVTTRRRADTVSIIRSRIDRLHSTVGPAWRWPDRRCLWALDGVEVPEWVVTAPSPTRIMSELASADQRRVGLAHYGWVKAVDSLNLAPIDVHPDPTIGTLYRLPDELSEGPDGMNLLIVRNASPNPDGTYAQYGLAAPASTRTAEAAQAALMRLTVAQYRALQVHT